MRLAPVLFAVLLLIGGVKPGPAPRDQLDPGLTPSRVPRGRLAASLKVWGLALTLVYFLLLGASAAGLYITEFRIVNTAIGGLFVAAWIFHAGANSDRTDQLTVAALILFLATCVTSDFIRLSLDAATSALALAAVFFVARAVFADERYRTMTISVMGLVGMVLSLIVLVWWGSTWIAWISDAGPGIPPLDLSLPTTPYHAQYMLALLIAMLLPAQLLIAGRGSYLRVLALVSIVLGIGVIFMSGGRSVWMGAVFGLLPYVARASSVRRSAGLLVGAAAALLLTALAVPQVLERIFSTETIEQRIRIWTATIDLWIQGPLVGSGPGSFPSAMTLTDYFAIDPEAGFHAHNAVLQVLAEGGLVGAGALVLLLIAVRVGWRRDSAENTGAASALLVFAGAAITDNPTVFPNVLIAALVWASLATAKRKFEVPRPRELTVRRAGVLTASLATAAVVALFSGWTLNAMRAHDAARAAASAGNGSAVVAHLTDAVSADPAFSLYRRELGVWLMSRGESQRAALELERAARENPVDATTARALSLLASIDGRDQDALAWGRRAVSLRATHVENLLTLTLAQLHHEDRAAATATLVDAIRLMPWITASPNWGKVIPSSLNLEALLERAAEEPGAHPRSEVATIWVRAMAGLPPTEAEESDIAALVIRCDLPAAATIAQHLSSTEAASNLIGRVMLATLEHDSRRDALVNLLALRDPSLEPSSAKVVFGGSPVWDAREDARLYGRLAIIPPDVGIVLPSRESGIHEWMTDPAKAARRGAPGSGLASCT